MQEKLILVDRFGRRTGVADRALCHQGKGLRHLAFVIFILSTEGRYLLQRRAGVKLGGDLWDVSATSHVRVGESYADAIKRCLNDELDVTGVSSPEYQLAFNYQKQIGDRAENEYCSLFTLRYDGEININRQEMDEIRWVTREELTLWFEADEGQFTHWFGEAFKRMSGG